MGCSDCTPDLSNVPERAARISRRALLQRAAFGAAAIGYAGLRVPGAWAGSGTTDEIDAFEGVLMGVNPNNLVVERWGAPVQVPVTAAATFWKGGDTGIRAFQEGDQVLVRLVSGSLTNAWANLTKVRGEIAKGSRGSYIVVDDLTKDEILLTTDGSSALVDAVTATPTVPTSLPIGTWVDAAGLAVDGGIIVSNVRYALPDAEPIYLPRSPKITGAGSDAALSFEYRNMGSWFSCPTGAGRCGTCNTSNSSQVAWPALDTCGCCSTSCCDCAKNCMAQVYLSCGSQVVLYDACSNIGNTCKIVDCGPCNNQSCHTRCTTVTCSHFCTECGGHETTPIVDLTKPTFAVFRNPAVYGCIEVRVTG